MSGWCRVGVLGLVAGGIAGLACSKGQKGPDGGAGGEQNTPPEVFAQSRFRPELVVLDQAGSPIRNATVVFGNLSVRSRDDGGATLPDQPVDQATVVTVRAEGYAPSTKTLSVANAYVPLPIELSKLLDFSLDAENGGAADVGSAQVRFPGRNYLRLDGTPYAGPVTVKAVTVFDASVGASDLTAGDRQSLTGGSDEALDLLAAVHVELQAADGGALRFAAGERAVLSFSLPADGGHAALDRLSLFELDEKTGRWQEGSSCTVHSRLEPGGGAKLACVGEVEHFSIWGVGRIRPRNFCRKLILRASTAFASDAPLRSWYVRLRGLPSLCTFATSTSAAPLGTCTLTGYVPGQPEKVWMDVVLATRWFQQQRQHVMAELPGSYDGSCPETVLYYNPTTRTLGAGVPPPEKPTLVDGDGDGYFARSVDTTLVPGEDCDDGNPAIHPGARPVLCTGKDHDCDGRPDISAVAPTLASLPDGIWNQHCPQARLLCSAAVGAEAPGNQRDEDCDGFVSDSDGDGYFRRSDPLFAASGKPADCNDYHALSHPGGTEVTGNIFDENCDGLAADQDGDGFPSAQLLAVEGKSQTTGAVDCNDLDPEAHPGSSVQDLPVMAPFYENGRRRREFCALFRDNGKPSAKLLFLFQVADRNCNGVLEDLDGDGRLVAAAGAFANPPPYDVNDLDPRIQVRGQTGSPNDSDCVADLESFGAGSRQVCPRLFNREQQCVDTYREGVATGEFACGAPEWNVFSIAPDPFAFTRQYGPCSTMVLPDCGEQSLCGGPITFAPWYEEALSRNSPAYDVSGESFTGFCMPICAPVP